jgi:plasmid stabilization system protein ParE
MKRYCVGFSRSADAQIEMIEAWWRENRPAAPEMFSRELEAVVRLLEISPLIGKAYPDAPVPEVRRLLIGRSRYHVYWKVDAASHAVTVLAVWHARRGSGPRL